LFAVATIMFLLFGLPSIGFTVAWFLICYPFEAETTEKINKFITKEKKNKFAT
jgi:hypothetical protein